jgi:hypothetical protein
MSCRSPNCCAGIKRVERCLAENVNASSAGFQHKKQCSQEHREWVGQTLQRGRRVTLVEDDRVSGELLFRP